MNELELFTGTTGKSMTVKQVAEALGCDDETVRRHVKSLWPSLFENGKTTYLNEAQALAVKVGLERSGRSDLRNVAELPSTELEMMLLDAKVSEWKTRRIAELTKANDILMITNSELEPKAAFFDAVTNSSDAIEMKDAAKALNIKGLGRNNLFEFLRDRGILMQNNTPYQTFIDRGYFRVIEQRWETTTGDTHINLKTVVYQKGLEFIRKELKA